MVMNMLIQIDSITITNLFIAYLLVNQIISLLLEEKKYSPWDKFGFRLNMQIRHYEQSFRSV